MLRYSNILVATDFSPNGEHAARRAAEIAKGSEALRREVDRVLPLVDDGGYIPELDHSVPPDISWPVFCEYMDYLKRRLQRG